MHAHMCSFARPVGVLGSSHQLFMVTPSGEGYNMSAPDSWVPWRIPDNSTFSLLAPGQNWHHVFDGGTVHSNIMSLNSNRLPTETFETHFDLQAQGSSQTAGNSATAVPPNY